MVDFHRQRLNNRPQGESEQATYWEIARWVCVGAIFVFLILTYAWLQTEILNINYRMEQIKKENHELRELNAALRVEQSALTQPETIDRQARALGLVSPNRQEVRILQSQLPPAPDRNLVAETFPSDRGTSQ